MNTLTRRSFLKSTAIATAGVALSARSWAQVAGANGDLRVAIVGLNGRGADHLAGFQKLPGVRVVALCDADTAVLEKAAQAAGGGVKTYVDLRDLLASPDIDAISIATPNHLHALQAIWACQAGKDVYVEKPVSHNVWEGRQLVAAAAKYQRIVQAGTQSRSSDGIAEAIAWVRAGHLGRITAARGLCYKRRPSIGKTTGPQPVPATVNYDLWLGPAPLTPLRRKRLHYDWHWQFPTGNGDVGNQGIHQMDIARWFLGEPALAPRTLSVGGRLGYEDDGDTPNTQIVVHDYASAPLLFEVRGLLAKPDTENAAALEAGGIEAAKAGAAKMDKYRGASVGVVIHCEGGYVVVPDYKSAQCHDRDGKLVKEFKGSSNHFGNFVDVVRSRKAADLRGPIGEGHISSALCHMGNLSHQLGRGVPAGELREKIKGNALLAEAFGRMAEHLAGHGLDLEKTPATLGVPLTLDPQAERFTGENAAAADARLTREYRAPFVVPALA